MGGDSEGLGDEEYLNERMNGAYELYEPCATQSQKQGNNFRAGID